MSQVLVQYKPRSRGPPRATPEMLLLLLALSSLAAANQESIPAFNKSKYLLYLQAAERRLEVNVSDTEIEDALANNTQLFNPDMLGSHHRIRS